MYVWVAFVTALSCPVMIRDQLGSPALATRKFETDPQVLTSFFKQLSRFCETSDDFTGLKHCQAKSVLENMATTQVLLLLTFVRTLCFPMIDNKATPISLIDSQEPVREQMAYLTISPTPKKDLRGM